jgi:hypothetical protein
MTPLRHAVPPSRADRHEHTGTGFIGMRGMRGSSKPGFRKNARWSEVNERQDERGTIAKVRVRAA